MAAALDAHWLAPGQRHGLTMTQVEQMLVTVNSSDPALRFYPLMNGLFHRGADAMGYIGPRCVHLGQHADKLVEWDVRCIVGRTHSWQAYEGSSLVMQHIAHYLFGESRSATPLADESPRPASGVAGLQPTRELP